MICNANCSSSGNMNQLHETRSFSQEFVAVDKLSSSVYRSRTPNLQLYSIVLITLRAFPFKELVLETCCVTLRELMRKFLTTAKIVRACYSSCTIWAAERILNCFPTVQASSPVTS